MIVLAGDRNTYRNRAGRGFIRRGYCRRLRRGHRSDHFWRQLFFISARSTQRLRWPRRLTSSPAQRGIFCSVALIGDPDSWAIAADMGALVHNDQFCRGARLGLGADLADRRGPFRRQASCFAHRGRRLRRCDRWLQFLSDGVLCCISACGFWCIDRRPHLCRSCAAGRVSAHAGFCGRDGSPRRQSESVIQADGVARVRCRVSRDALDDHFSDGDRLRPNAAFEKYRNDVEALARRKYLRAQLESDKSVVIGTNEISYQKN
jgi:hypothetical protein